MTWQDLYIVLAEDLSNALESPPQAEPFIGHALDAVLNKASGNNGVNIEITFLKLTSDLYQRSRRLSYNMESQIRQFALAMNKFTIRYYGDLTTFVNSLDWHDGCIPFQWWTISEDIGYDTSGWDGCAS